MEHKRHRLIGLAPQLLLDVFLCVVEDLWLEAHVPRRVHAVHIPEG
eukprot:CAMPEP_0198489134 /NCGR_PEP_ID=MMETSP1462-20131121/1254_1 /TAXON_ID=1333877 /ORGANISM="Brandtodinium nutriculum, Strain RCC3387" /LENGTH=45 /DNA_ID= /DNA_START= /DNA_END= /DNA_ORIENTATION=